MLYSDSKWLNCTEGLIGNDTALKNPSDEYFHKQVLHINDDISNIGTLVWPLVGCLFLAWLLVFLSFAKGVKSMGKVSENDFLKDF